MKEYKINSLQTFDVPMGANKLTIQHEWGDVIVNAASVSGTYDFTSDSIGVFKFVWLDGTVVVATEFYSFVLPLISSSEFFTDNENLEDFDDDFSKLERLIRHIIQNFTGQKFGPYVNKSMEVQGDGGDSLFVPVPITALSAAANNYGDSVYDRIEVSPNDPHFLQVAPRFRGSYYYEPKRDITWDSFETFSDKFTFVLTGDWGYEYVPTDVSEAAKLLVANFMGESDLQDMISKGIFRAKLGDFEVWLNADKWGSTGNAYADNLLSGYVNIGIGLV